MTLITPMYPQCDAGCGRLGICTLEALVLGPLLRRIGGPLWRRLRGLRFFEPAHTTGRAIAETGSDCGGAEHLSEILQSR
jgi:hypothetical protein